MLRTVFKYFAFLAGLLIIILIIVGLKYYLIVTDKRLPYRNILDDYGYIYVNIKAHDKSCTIVEIGNRLINILSFKDSTDYFTRSSLSRKLVVLRSVFKVNSSIKNHKGIEVSDSVYSMLKPLRIDESKIKLFESMDLIKEGYLRNSSDYSTLLFNDSVGMEDFNTIIYVMLKNNIMDCKRYCASGGTYLEFETKK